MIVGGGVEVGDGEGDTLHILYCITALVFVEQYFLGVNFMSHFCHTFFSTDNY